MGRHGLKLSSDRMARISALDELELEEFAEHLREEGVNIGKETLEDIKAELCHPYRDTRGNCGARGPLERERLFELLTSETQATLCPGSVVFVRFVRFEPGRQVGGKYIAGCMHVVLQSGLAGMISEDRISDRWDRVPSVEETTASDGRYSQTPQV